VCKVTKTVAVVLDGVSAEEFEKYSASLPTLQQAFDLVGILKICKSLLTNIGYFRNFM